MHPCAYDLAADLGDSGATVNVIAPGYVAQTAHWLASPAAFQITAQVVQLNGGVERGR